MSHPDNGILVLWQGMNLWAAFVHYAFDGMIWKLRRPETAAALGVSGPVNRSELRLVVGCMLAVCVPAAVLHFTAAADRRAAGLTAPPFAWPRMLVAHLVTALPLGLIVARAGFAPTSW